jgi:hypothetical protein
MSCSLRGQPRWQGALPAPPNCGLGETQGKLAAQPHRVVTRENESEHNAPVPIRAAQRFASFRRSIVESPGAAMGRVTFLSDIFAEAVSVENRWYSRCLTAKLGRVDTGENLRKMRRSACVRWEFGICCHGSERDDVEPKAKFDGHHALAEDLASSARHLGQQPRNRVLAWPSWHLPARHATRVDPVEVLRRE